MEGATLRFGSDNLRFEGKIDFNGKKLIRNATSGSTMFHIIGENGIIENIVYDTKFNNKVELNRFLWTFYV